MDVIPALAERVTGLFQFCPPSLLTACAANSTVTAADCSSALSPSTGLLLLSADVLGNIIGSTVYSVTGNDTSSSSVIGRLGDEGSDNFTLLTPGWPGVWSGSFDAVVAGQQGCYISFPVTTPFNTSFSACWVASESV